MKPFDLLRRPIRKDPERAKRVDLHRVVLVQVERKVEELDDRVKELTAEVDHIDFEPVYQCDCSCDGDIQDMQILIDEQQKVLDLMITRLEGLEAKLAMQH